MQNSVLFPLGLTHDKTPAESLLPGHLLTAMGSAGHVLSVGLLLAAALAIAVSLVIRPPRDVPAAAWRLAIGLALIFLLGPDVRFGYFIYPLGLLGWLALTRQAPSGPRVRRRRTTMPPGPWRNVVQTIRRAKRSAEMRVVEVERLRRTRGAERRGAASRPAGTGPGGRRGRRGRRELHGHLPA